MLKLFIAGQKSFGAAVYKAVRNAGHSVTGVDCPADGQYYDRLRKPPTEISQSLSLLILTNCAHLIFQREQMS